MLLANLTLLHLSSSLHLHRSSFFSLPLSSSPRWAVFACLQLSHFISRAISFAPSLSTTLSRSSFSHFLDSAVTTTSAQFLIDKVYVFTRQEFDEQLLAIWNCQFRDFHVPENGGAFWANHSVELYNVHFRNCTSAKDGGAFACRGTLRAIYATFIQSLGASGAGIAIASRANDTVSVNSSLFVQLESKTKTCFFVRQGASVAVTGTNFTRTRSNIDTGGFESSASQLRLTFSLLSRTASGQANGGIVLNGRQIVVIESVRFERCGHRSDGRGVAAALVVTDVGAGSRIANCVFDRCQRSGGFTVLLDSGESIALVGCCFTEKKIEAILANNVSVIETDTKFEVEQCDGLSRKFENIGFLKSRTPTYTPAYVDPKEEEIDFGRGEVPVIALRAARGPRALCWTTKRVIVAGAFVLTFLFEYLSEKCLQWLRKGGFLKRERQFD